MAGRRFFYSELNRRNVLRAGLLYVGATWAVSQGISQLTPALALPEWTTRAFLIACAVCFPIALVLAWHFDIDLHGLRRDASAESPAPPALDAKGATAVADPESSLDIPEKSIAVLPFSDLSPEHNQEYFSDGIAEEILHALVKLRDLKVAGRTSSFSFKGRNEDVRAIGRALAVAHVLEGSVRKHGDRVRITAQLIRTDNGYHLWSDTFDGELADVFELQERIARAVALEFDVILEAGGRLMPAATSDPEAYALYLEAAGIYNRRDIAHLAYAAEMLAKAIEIDPRFARAYSRLAAVHALQSNLPGADAQALVTTVMKEAAQASALDPGLGEPYTAIGLALTCARRFVDSRDALEMAQQVQPEDAAVWYWSGTLTLSLGYTRLGCQWLDRALALDPLYPAALLWRGVGYVSAGDLERGERLFRKASDAGLVHAWMGMHEITAARGRPREAAAQLARGMALLAAGLPRQILETLANGAYGDAADRARALALIDELVAGRPRSLPSAIPYILLLMGEELRALDLGRRFGPANEVLYFHRLWMPSMRALRASTQFGEFARCMGLTALWDRYGAPDGSHRDAAGNYVWT